MTVDKMKQAFLSLPDTVIITDKYLNVLEYNRCGPYPDLKKNTKLTDYMPDFGGIGETNLQIDGRSYLCRISSVQERGAAAGFTVYLADTTEKTRLLEQNRQKSRELTLLVEQQRAANAELTEYVRQAEAVIDYEEQRRIAHHIHDNAGHAITAIHTISQMCLKLRDTDRAQYERLLREGISLCERALEARQPRKYASLSELLDCFRLESPFPMDIAVSGEEPPFASELYDVIYAVCKEAHHNTLSHSLADRQSITAEFTPDTLTLSIFDNGHFHGSFEKGFGLSATEKRVRASGGSIRFHAAEGEGFGVVARWRRER